MKIHLALAFISIVSVALAQSLAPLTQAHQSATTALTTQRTAELTRLRQPYLAALVAADQTATKAGNAAALRAIEQERDAVNAGKLRAELSEALPRAPPPSVARSFPESNARCWTSTKGKKQWMPTTCKNSARSSSRPPRDPAVTEQIAQEKTRVLSGISGAITDLKSGLAGTKWRLFEGDGYKELRFGEDGKVNGNWNYEVIARDKVKVIWDKSSAMTLTLGKNGASLSAGDKTWVLDRQ